MSVLDVNMSDRKNCAVKDNAPIRLAHGGGGQLTDELLTGAILPRLRNDALSDLLDAGLFTCGNERLAMTVDSYVVQPLFFRGGDIGRLAVCGTVNDLAVMGARPLAVALSLVIEEGLKRGVLDRLLDSIASTAREAGVNIITGDTKVVGRGQGDGLYITTAGVGAVPLGLDLHPSRIEPGDVVLINGPIADHGLAVMLARELPEVQSVLQSDAAPLNPLIQSLLEAVPTVHFMRDVTRGGLACVVADLASRTRLHVTLNESAIPLRPETRHVADLLGLDPLEVANEGKVVVVVSADDASRALAVMQAHDLGIGAAVIGEVDDRRDGLCSLRTTLGGERIVLKPYGEQLPRIC